jgi:DNA-binding transcriptional LysR family regulator
MLNVARLKILDEVARRGSISAAADALDYTQSAVSQQIAALEAETGMALLQRRRGGRLRMASFPTAGATLMPLAIASFRARHPEVELTLAEGEPEQIEPRLRAGEIDLALLFEFGAPSPADELVRVALLEDPLYLALPREHVLAQKRRLRLEDLHGEAWVQTSSSSPCARQVVRSCHAAGFEPNVAFESDDYQTVQGLVAAGVGVALIPELALNPVVREDIAIRALSPRPPVREVVAATPAGARLLPAAPAMLAELEVAAARYEALTPPRAT